MGTLGARHLLVGFLMNFLMTTIVMERANLQENWTHFAITERGVSGEIYVALDGWIPFFFLFFLAWECVRFHGVSHKAVTRKSPAENCARGSLLIRYFTLRRKKSPWCSFTTWSWNGKVSWCRKIAGVLPINEKQHRKKKHNSSSVDPTVRELKNSAVGKVFIWGMWHKTKHLWSTIISPYNYIVGMSKIQTNWEACVFFCQIKVSLLMMILKTLKTQDIPRVKCFSRSIRKERICLHRHAQQEGMICWKDWLNDVSDWAGIKWWTSLNQPCDSNVWSLSFQRFKVYKTNRSMTYLRC